MPTDRYTKTVLTIIAGALVAILVQRLMPLLPVRSTFCK